MGNTKGTEKVSTLANPWEFLFPKSTICCNLAKNCTEFIWVRFHRAPKDKAQVDLLISFWWGELECLQQAAEDDEKLHLGHHLSQAHTMTCRGRGNAVSPRTRLEPYTFCHYAPFVLLFFHKENITASHSESNSVGYQHTYLLRRLGTPLGSQNSHPCPRNDQGWTGEGSPNTRGQKELSLCLPWWWYPARKML